MKKLIALLSVAGMVVLVLMALSAGLAAADSPPPGHTDAPGAGPEPSAACSTCHGASFAWDAMQTSIHGPWNDTPEACARCHRTHTGQGDDLIVMATKDELCLFCHGTAGTAAETDVQGGVIRSSGEPLRGGGFSNAKMNSSAWGAALPTTAAASTSKHSISGLGGPASPIIWGAGSNATSKGDYNFYPTADAGLVDGKLECVSCHDPHTFGATYRMLSRRPGADGMSGISKHPAPTDPSWKQFVYVRDQMAYAESLLLAGNGAGADAVLQYTVSTTAGYNRPEVPGLTETVIVEGGADGIFGTADDVTEVRPVYYTTVNGTDWDPGVDLVFGTADDVTTTRMVSWGSAGSTMPEYSQQLNTFCAACHDRYNAQKGLNVTAGMPGTPSAMGGVPGSLGGTNGSNDAIFRTRHKTGDYIGATAAETACSYGCHLNKQLACLNCHVAHGTSSQMGDIVKAESWPGEAGPSTYDGMTVPATAQESPQKTGKYTDYDGDNRSNLLRLDNRGVCQNSFCHPKGKVEDYLAGH